MVSWEIANATNVFAFEIQRSIDGTRFEKIAEVPFDYYFQKYEYFDNGLKPGKYFYRLKIKDFDGSFTFSDMNAVNIGEITSISIFPSASDGFFNVQLSKADDWNVQTYTLDGKLVFSSAFFGNETTLDLSFLPASMYVLKIYSKTSTSYNSIQILR